MNNKLIIEMIRHKLMLLENRLPALIKKWSGTRTIKIPHTAERLLAGKSQESVVIPKLSTIHDNYAEHELGLKPAVGRGAMTYTDEHRSLSTSMFIGGQEEYKAEDIVNKIAEADPTPNKEYTDRMLHWYAESAKPWRFTIHLPSIGVPMNPSEDLMLKIARENNQQVTTEIDEKHSNIHKLNLEDLGRATEALSFYHRIKGRLPAEHRTIDKINSLHHLESIVDPLRQQQGADDIMREAEKSSSKEHQRENFPTIYEDEHVRVHYMKTKEGSCKYGQGSKWCVSGTNYNAYDEYNKKSPLLMFVDKKGVLNQHLVPSAIAPNKDNFRRYMFTFGKERGNTDINGYSDHQLMDESNDPFNYDTFIKHFPQTRNLPELQHQHQVLFQSRDQKDRHSRVAYAGVDTVKSIRDHLAQFPEFARPNAESAYLSGFLTRKMKLQDTQDPDDEHKTPVLVHNNYVMKHYLGDTGVPPTASKEESHNFITQNAHELSPTSVQHIFNHKIYDFDANSTNLKVLPKLAERGRGKVDRKVYNILRNRREFTGNSEHPGSDNLNHEHSLHRELHNSRFFDNLVDPNTIQQVYHDSKHNHIQDSDVESYPKVKGIMTALAKNRNTPDHILNEMAQTATVAGESSSPIAFHATNNILLKLQQRHFGTQ